jgi:hypothetical protein
MDSLCDSVDYHPYDNMSFNIDAQVSTILVITTEMRNKSIGSNTSPGAHIQRDNWFNHDAKSQEIWDHEKYQLIILHHDNKRSNTSDKPSKRYTDMCLLK